MRTWMWLAVLTGLVACGDEGEVKDDTDVTDGETDTVGDTDTDADADADSDADTDTDIDTDAEESGFTDSGGPAVRTAGCAPDFTLLVEPEYVDCSASSVNMDLLNGGVLDTVERTWNTDGQLATAYYRIPADGVDQLETYTYDVDGAVDTITIDVMGDGAIELTLDYTFAYDGSGRVVTQQVDFITEAGTTTEIIDQTWGVCDVDLLEYDMDGDGTYDANDAFTYFTDGWQLESDEDGDGSTDVTADYFVDAATGQPIRYEEENFAPNGAIDFEQDWTSFDANGAVTAVDAIIAIDYLGGGYKGQTVGIELSWAYDADNRETSNTQTQRYMGQVIYAAEETTTWTCPP